MLSGLFRVIVTVSAINLAYLAWFDSYDFRIGPLHLVAHGFFKPLLILGMSFYLAILTREPEAEPPPPAHSARWMWVTLAAISVFWFAMTAAINPLYDEWNYRQFSHDIHVSELFTSSQLNAWYRPLGFFSLWIDSKIFGGQLWGYHLQNLGWHLANAVLVLLFARRVGLSEPAAQWGAILFAGASSCYEAVMWPSSRFDLMAMTFVSLALIWSIDYLRSDGERLLGGIMFAYTLALLCKESGYAFPILLLPVAWTYIAERARVAKLLGATALVSVALFVLRWILVGGIGGYADHAGTGSPHLTLTFTTFYALLTRTFPFTLIAVNQTFPLPAWARAATSVFALSLAAVVWLGASTTKRQRWLALYAMISTIPVATLISWLDPRAQHVRYLYMPAFFIMLLTACALVNARRPWVAPMFLLLGLTCAAHNIRAYALTYARADQLAEKIAADAPTSDAPAAAAIYGMPPDEFNGVLFSHIQLELRLKQLRPSVNLAFLDSTDGADCSRALCYQWIADTRDLQRVRP
jgi:hypothetical protein